MGIGVVIQNHIGYFFAGMSMAGSRAESAEVAEFMAARAALTFALDVGFTSIILEGDNLSVINGIRLREDCLVSAGVFVADISMKAQLCNNVDFSFVKREGNNVAHSLAKFARQNSDFMVWLKDPPVWLVDSLNRDVTSIQ